MSKGKWVTRGVVVGAAALVLGFLGGVVLLSVLLASVLEERQDPGTCRSASAGDTKGIPEKWVSHVEDAAAVSGLPVEIHAAMTDKESGWDENAVNPSSGAAGMAQAMPGTWAMYGTGDPMNGADALAFQGRYMKVLMDLAAGAGLSGQAQIEAALGAYNWGPGAMAAAGWDWRKGPSETVSYVSAIMDRAQVEFTTDCAPVAYDGDLGDGEWAPPLPGGKLISGFGLRNIPGLPSWAQNHVGIDLVTPDGGTVVAPTDLKVTAIYDPDGCVMARATTTPRFGFAMCHLDDWRVKVGQTLTRGDVIGTEGTRAASVGVGVIRHLHFELYHPDSGDPKYPGPSAPGVIDPTEILRAKGAL